MAGVLKILFDLSLYYTLTGFYLRCVSGQAPSAICFLALVLCAALDAFLRARGVKSRFLRFLPLLLPFLSLLARPGLIPFLHCVPAWAYAAFSILTQRLDMRYDGFRSHFGYGLKCLLLLVLGPLFPGMLRDAALGTIPYLVLMLVSGVCLLRLLREGRGGGVRQALYMAVFVLFCAGLTVGRAPQLLMKGVGLFWSGVVAPAVFLVAVVMAAALYIFYLLAKWLVERAQGETPTLDISLQSTAEMLGIEDQYNQYTADISGVLIVLIFDTQHLRRALQADIQRGRLTLRPLDEPFGEQIEDIERRGHDDGHEEHCRRDDPAPEKPHALHQKLRRAPDGQSGAEQHKNSHIERLPNAAAAPLAQKPEQAYAGDQHQHKVRDRPKRSVPEHPREQRAEDEQEQAFQPITEMGAKAVIAHIQPLRQNAESGISPCGDTVKKGDQPRARKQR